MNPQIVAARRRRLVVAKIEALKKRTGSNMQMVKLDDGSMVPVELSVESLIATLRCVFETPVYARHGYHKGDEVLSAHYEQCMGVSKMSPHGAMFMDAVLVNMVIERNKDREEANKAIGLRGR